MNSDYKRYKSSSDITREDRLAEIDPNWSEQYLDICGIDEFTSSPFRVLSIDKRFSTQINKQIFARPGEPKFTLKEVTIDGPNILLKFDRYGEIRISNFKRAMLHTLTLNEDTYWGIKFIDHDSLKSYIVRDGTTKPALDLLKGDVLELNFESHKNLDFSPNKTAQKLPELPQFLKNLLKKK